MTLKEKFETLRGTPILLKTPVEQIPCNETSNPEKLCKHPVVSVHMLAYNHEKYIAQAIEGVVMQETDFEYELVIGEDASPDRTREICFEYQKKYPDKIRVLWSEENVTKTYGGNGARITARCRGEFIAFCEGDDYWTDPRKLQKQVDIFRKYPNVGLCHGGAELYYEATGIREAWLGSEVFPKGFMERKHFFSWHLFGRMPDSEQWTKERFIMTATVMLRRSVFEKAIQQYEIFKWRLALGDSPLWLGISSLSDTYFLPEQLSVYRRHSGGACATNGLMVTFDATLIRYYYAQTILNVKLFSLPNFLKYTLFTFRHIELAKNSPNQMHIIWQQLRLKEFRKAYLYNLYTAPIIVLNCLGLMRFDFFKNKANCYLYHSRRLIARLFPRSHQFNAEYIIDKPLP